MVDAHIRAEAAGDVAAVRRVNEAAFGRPAEADLVDALRRVVHPYLALVAEGGDGVVGHALFTPVEVRAKATPPSGEAPLIAAGLAPMAVLPDYQREGIGSALVREGLQRCRQAGYGAVFVLGHPDYYPRFGFAPAHTRGFSSEYDVPDEVFMVLELRPDALDGEGGVVRYHPAFNEL